MSGYEAAQTWVLAGGLLVSIVTLIYLIKYVRATKGIESAAAGQTAASQDLACWQRKQWELDSRKQEWRELIGTLTEAFQKVELMIAPMPHVFALATPQGAARQADARWALVQAAVLNDRLFILDVVENEHIREDWRDIEVMSDQLNPVQQGQITATASTAGITDFQQKWVAFHRKLVKLAQADSGIVNREGAAH
jgi:hypothetical protein